MNSSLNHDRLFKELLSTFFLEFIELFFPQVIHYLEPNTLQLLDKEVFTDVTSGEEHIADLIAQVKFQGEDSFFLIHIEAQSSSQTEFSRRMFRYFARLYEKYYLPIYPIALFSYDKPKREEPNSHQMEFPDYKVLEFNYRVVQLNRLNWRDFLRQENPVAAALMAKMAIQPEERAQVKAECLRLLATLRLNPAKMKLISGFVDSYLRLSSEEEEEFETYIQEFQPQQQEEVMEIVTSWMERGQKGEALTLVLKLLSRRVGSLNSELESAISELSLTQLEALAEALLEFNSLQDLQQWLEDYS
ncbi:MAG: Rpn family recombination-promoting nuclease/putative transposase [Cyanobacteriota bacterium]